MPDINPVRDPMTGHLRPGARLPGGGNPLARAHYQYRKAFIDACTPQEWDDARALLVKDVLSNDPKIRRAARDLYYELMCGKQLTIDAHVGSLDEATARNATEATLGRILAVLERFPEIKSDVASALLGDLPAIDAVSIEVGTNGQGD